MKLTNEILKNLADGYMLTLQEVKMLANVTDNVMELDDACARLSVRKEEQGLY